MNKPQYYTYEGTLFKLIHFNSLNSCCLMLGLNKNSLKTYPIEYIETYFEPLTNYDESMIDLLYGKKDAAEAVHDLCHQILTKHLKI